MLNRLDQYEELLRDNKVEFEPLHEEGMLQNGNDETDDERSWVKASSAATPSSTVKSEKNFGAKSVTLEEWVRGC